jgi:hypothetical protein
VKAAPKKDVSAQAHAAAKAKVAENATKPKKPAKSKKAPAKTEESAAPTKPMPKKDVSSRAYIKAKAKLFENISKAKEDKAKAETSPKKKAKEAKPKVDKKTEEKTKPAVTTPKTKTKSAPEKQKTETEKRKDGAKAQASKPAAAESKAETAPKTSPSAPTPSRVPENESGWKSYLDDRIKEVDSALTDLTLGKMSKEDGEKLLALVKQDHKNSLQAHKNGVIETYTPHGRPISGSFDILEGRMESAVERSGQSGGGLAALLKSIKDNTSK